MHDSHTLKKIIIIKIVTPVVRLKYVPALHESTHCVLLFVRE